MKELICFHRACLFQLNNPVSNVIVLPNLKLLYLLFYYVHNSSNEVMLYCFLCYGGFSVTCYWVNVRFEEVTPSHELSADSFVSRLCESLIHWKRCLMSLLSVALHVQRRHAVAKKSDSDDVRIVGEGREGRKAGNLSNEQKKEKRSVKRNWCLKMFVSTSASWLSAALRYFLFVKSYSIALWVVKYFHYFSVVDDQDDVGL